MLKIHSRYDLPPQVDTTFFGESLTQQHFKDECDINNIIARAQVTGSLVDPLNPSTRQPLFDDFTSAPDFMAAQNMLVAASEAFNALPAALRKRFDNDPAELLAFLDDDANREEAVKLGLIQKVDADPVGTNSARVPDDGAS